MFKNKQSIGKKIIS